MTFIALLTVPFVAAGLADVLATSWRDSWTSTTADARRVDALKELAFRRRGEA